MLGSGSTEKERGGEAFKRGEYSRAERHYTAALGSEAETGSHDAAILLSNRSACYAKLARAKCVPTERERESESEQGEPPAQSTPSRGGMARRERV